ncbi:hypothetical protein SKAU_G00286310 [Synaphobranchus kaupii]|uniref:Uncharacterized protein n=1 Tax=Synaphobranchus kaupii TaxID=118154 RepID=A0A9Q1IPG3_SYNKA|nr:hypothetical protein SKAU_G00286310 [Synaphobranchus kaupii]
MPASSVEGVQEKVVTAQGLCHITFLHGTGSRRRAPCRYDDGEAAHQWKDPEEYYRSQFLEVIDLLTSELTRRFDQPTLHLLKNIENVVLTAVNSSPGCVSISIPKNVVDMYTGDVDMERLSTQLSMFPAVLRAHNSSAETPIRRVTKVSTIVDMLATQGGGTQSLFSEVDRLLRLYLTVPMSNATAEQSYVRATPK